MQISLLEFVQKSGKRQQAIVEEIVFFLSQFDLIFTFARGLLRSGDRTPSHSQSKEVMSYGIETRSPSKINFKSEAFYDPIITTTNNL
ncbi:MAG: hypothetical protein AB4426_10845 [Xenococcaceae cyanobacterium]